MSQTKIEEIMEGFEYLDDWEDRYAYLIDLGKGVEGLSEDERIEEHRVKGCTSQVWLVWSSTGEGEEAQLTFRGDSDAHIVRGLVSVLLSAYTGKTPHELLEVDIEALFKRMGLEKNLSVSRRNGFFSMVERVRSVAQQHLSA